MEKVKSFYIKESIRNKGCFLLICITDNDKEFVVSGDPHVPMYLKPVDECWYIEQEKHETNN